MQMQPNEMTDRSRWTALYVLC
ncbi:MAG: hypothetical protein QOE27_351, partial [Solirubrobacteraceae bacterium]|nr:hypothetical protein [Solirubrobacteraceae bacterium]